MKESFQLQNQVRKGVIFQCKRKQKVDGYSRTDRDKDSFLSSLSDNAVYLSKSTVYEKPEQTMLESSFLVQRKKSFFFQKVILKEKYNLFPSRICAFQKDSVFSVERYVTYSLFSSSDRWNNSNAKFFLLTGRFQIFVLPRKELYAYISSL